MEKTVKTTNIYFIEKCSIGWQTVEISVEKGVAVHTCKGWSSTKKNALKWLSGKKHSNK